MTIRQLLLATSSILLALSIPACGARAEQVLDNGIKLSDPWPPGRSLEELRSGEPMRIPYLERPPEVIPIDAGRQLFVDDFLIEQTTLQRRFHKPELYEGNPVLRPDKRWEVAFQPHSTLAVCATAPPAGRLQPIEMKRWRVDSRLWSDRLKAVIVHWIPHCIAKISDPELPEGGINNFVEAARKLAGKPHGPHRRAPFSNVWVYNTIEAISYALGGVRVIRGRWSDGDPMTAIPYYARDNRDPGARSAVWVRDGTGD